MNNNEIYKDEDELDITLVVVNDVSGDADEWVNEDYMNDRMDDPEEDEYYLQATQALLRVYINDTASQFVIGANDWITNEDLVNSKVLTQVEEIIGRPVETFWITGNSIVFHPDRSGDYDT